MRIAIGIFLAFVLSDGIVRSFTLAPLPRAVSLHSTCSKLGAAASENEKTPAKIQPDILEPFLPAADPMYPVRGPVGEGDFILSRSGGPVEEELSDENLLRILRIECSDLEVRVNVLYGEARSWERRGCTVLSSWHHTYCLLNRSTHSCGNV
jgi:hypothetical protein